MLGFKVKERTVEEKRELAKGARAILEDPSFQAAVEAAEKRLTNELIRAVSTEEKLNLVAKLQCLMQIAAELAVEINDYRMAATHARRAGPG